MPPPPVVRPDEIRPRKARYWFPSLILALSFVIGIGLFVVANIKYGDDAESVAGALMSVAGWLAIGVGTAVGKTWIILIAVKRGQHFRQLQLQRRAEQMGWVQPSPGSADSQAPLGVQ